MFFLALFLSGCTPQSGVTIKLERQICLGTCPGYELEILQDGTVKYHGTDFVAVKGNYTWSIPRDELSTLAGLFAQVSCPPGSDLDEMIIDGPTYRASLTKDGATVEIEDSGSRVCKTNLTDGRTIFDAIDSATGAMSLVNVDDKTIRLLERVGFDFRSRQAASTLLMTLKARHADLARQLVARGAPVVGGRMQEISDDPYPAPAIFLIPPLADVDLARLVLEKTGSLDGPTQQGFLISSAQSGCPAMMELALEHAGMEIPATPSLLSIAASARKYDDGTFNLERYARSDHALWVKCFDPAGVIRLLLGAGARADIDIAGSTALHDADDAASVQTLIDAGADPNARDSEGKTPLHHVDDPGAVEVLLGAGADVNLRDNSGQTPLFGKYDADAVRLLIRAGADARATDKAGWTALFYVSDPAVTGALIEAGIDVNARDDEGRTALDVARDTRSVTPMLQGGARASTEAALAKVIDWAGRNERSDLVKALRKTKPLSP